MSWESFLSGLLLVGFLFSLLSFLAGAHSLHLPRGFMGTRGTARAARRSQASPINFGTVAAFLAWFGGTGYLLERYSSIWVYWRCSLPSLSGLGGAAVVFWFLVKVLLKQDRDLDPADYDMIGVLGHVSSPIRDGRHGRNDFFAGRSAPGAPARSEDGQPIAKGVEVVVTRYEKGIAYVRRWEEMSAARSDQKEN